MTPFDSYQKLAQNLEDEVRAVQEKRSQQEQPKEAHSLSKATAPAGNDEAEATTYHAATVESTTERFIVELAEFIRCRQYLSLEDGSYLFDAMEAGTEVSLCSILNNSRTGPITPKVENECPHCEGTGNDPEGWECYHCGGLGEAEKYQPDHERDYTVQMDRLCSALHVAGYVHYDSESQALWVWHPGQFHANCYAWNGRKVDTVGLLISTSDGAKIAIHKHIAKKRLEQMIAEEKDFLDRIGYPHPSLDHWTDDADESVCGCSDPDCDCEGIK